MYATHNFAGVYSTAACDKFNELVLERELRMTVVSVNDVGVCTVNLAEVTPGGVIPCVDLGCLLVQSGLVKQAPATPKGSGTFL